jgi:hypothetical protein
MDLVLNHYESESAKTTTELSQKNCTPMPCEILGSADTAAAAQIGVSEAVQHVGMVDFNCLPADFNSVTNTRPSVADQCLSGSDLEVDFSFDNLDQGYQYMDRVC